MTGKDVKLEDGSLRGSVGMYTLVVEESSGLEWPSP